MVTCRAEGFIEITAFFLHVAQCYHPCPMLIVHTISKLELQNPLTAYRNATIRHPLDVKHIPTSHLLHCFDFLSIGLNPVILIWSLIDAAVIRWLRELAIFMSYLLDRLTFLFVTNCMSCTSKRMSY